jgi:hypothetical protein
MVSFSLLFYSINLICISISIIICLNKKIILINKFSIHNQVNVLACKIKYLDLHSSFNFSIFIFSYRLWFFFHLLTCIVVNLFNYMYHNFFNFQLKKINYKNMLKKLIYIIFYFKKYLAHDKAVVKYKFE